jgi:hypothetical protein
MLIVVLLVMNTGRNVNGDETPTEDPPRPQQPQNKTEDQTDTYGLGGHILNEDGNMTLTKGTRLAKEADLKNYQKSGRGEFKGCKVTKDKEMGMAGKGFL